jgi:hypothetical protein
MRLAPLELAPGSFHQQYPEAMQASQSLEFAL